MQFQDFVKGIRKKIASLKNQDTDLHNEATKKEDEIVVKELNKLLETLSQDDREIDKENVKVLLRPFKQFLEDRYQRVALSSDLPYGVVTRANQICRILANKMIVVENQFEFKRRSEDDLLMPDIVWKMSYLKKKYIDKIDTILNAKSWQYNLFIDLESFDALLKLKEVLLNVNDDDLVTVENIKPILNLFDTRWRLIANPDADDAINDTNANQIYKNLAENIHTILKKNEPNLLGFNVENMLKPANVLDKINDNDTIKKYIFDKLLKESNEKKAESLTNILKSLTISEADFAIIILQEIKHIPDDSASKNTLNIYMEGMLSLHELKALCNQFARSEEPVKDLSGFINFFNLRAESINGTRADHQVYPLTKANQVCRVLADLFCLFTFKIDQFAKLQTNVLKYLDAADLTELNALEKLQLTVTKKITNLEKLLSSFNYLDANLWDDYLNQFAISRLIGLVTHEQHTEFSDLLKWRGNETLPQNDYKKLFYIILHVYSRLREENNSEYNTFIGRMSVTLGKLSSLFPYVPNRDEKLAAVKDVKQLLTSDLSLKSIVETIHDEALPYHQKHFKALNDSSLKQVMSHLYDAASDVNRKELQGEMRLTMS